jgi:cobalt/nickel transport system permease protein
MLFSPEPMHIPDGFLSLPLALVLWLISAAFIAAALRRVERDLDERALPLMGVLAAAIFAGQMLNFAVAGGTSGHLIGAALATVLLGPWPAMLVMTSVVVVQALIFQDGGLLALGANMFNMAVIGVLVAYAVQRLFQHLAGGKRWALVAGGFAAAWSSTVAAALACGLQLAISGLSPANLAVPAMGAVHVLIGIGEGLITAGALAFLSAARRDLVAAPPGSQRADRPVWVGGMLLAFGLAVASPLASTHPDGLEWVAERQRFLAAARSPLYQLIPDYLLPGIENEALATILAGVIGLLLVAAVSLLLARGRRRAGKTGQA